MATLREPTARAAARAQSPAILRPGQNCWRVERAARFSCVQDAADYFRLVRQALLQAQHSVFIVGWDIQASLDLVPDTEVADAPSRLDELLAYVVRRRPALRCYVLIWDYAALYTLERDPFARWRLGWRMPRQVRFGFDDHHPVGGSHHQKIVVVDDALAFCGGIDLTGHRWDTTAHRLEEPARTTALGAAYGPYHEVQAMLSGPAAASFGLLVRDRWRALGEEPRPAVAGFTADLWPGGVTPDLEDVDVGISRTVPASERDGEIRECERLFADSIAAARDAIYLESQYFTHAALGGALADRLREPDGPEVIAVIPRECHGWLERQTMGALREAVSRHLIEADRHGRLRLVYPAASRAADVPTFVHSKVTIVDDTFVRIGSANFSRRSMGVDTECDVTAEVADARGRAGVRHIRARLLGEHLGLAPGDVDREIARLGSIGALIDARTGADRTLVLAEVPPQAEPLGAVLQTAADPGEPIQFGPALAEWIPPLDARADRGVIRWWLPGAVLVVTVAAVTRLAMSPGVDEWRAALDGTRLGLGVGAAVFVVAQLAFVPMELLAFLSGLAMGIGPGGIAAIAGASVAAVIGYAAGRTLRPADLARWMSRRAYRSARQLGARGIAGVAVLRLTSIASGTSVHLVCGAGRVPFGVYVAGSVLGLTPMVAALSTLGGLLRQAVLQPSTRHWLMAGGFAIGLAAAAAVLRAFLLLRQFVPSVSRQRERAEFG